MPDHQYMSNVFGYHSVHLSPYHLRAKNSVKHFPVRWDGREFGFGFGKFATVSELLEHFESKPVIGGESGEEPGCLSDLGAFLVYSVLCVVSLTVVEKLKEYIVSYRNIKQTLAFSAPGIIITCSLLTVMI